MATQEVRIKEFITQAATDWKSLWAKIGSGALNTSSTNLIAAINEVKTTADAAVEGTAPDASESVKGIVELATNAETVAGVDAGRAVTPAGVDAAIDARVATASTTLAGISELASDSEALAMSAADRVITPANLAAIRGVNNGVASLDAGGKVPSIQLPAFVDDILEVTNQAALPAVGAVGIIYVTLDNNKAWRWGGSTYVEVSGSPGTTDALAEGSTNLYFTNTRADARADSRITALLGDPDSDLAAYYTAAKA